MTHLLCVQTEREVNFRGGFREIMERRLLYTVELCHMSEAFCLNGKAGDEIW